MRILVCGGRTFTDKQLFLQKMAEIEQKYGPFRPTATVIINGGARGADTLAAEYGYSRCFAVRTFHADWAKFGKRAGGLRNQQMLDEAKPDLVIAFPGGVGTADMVARAKWQNVPLEEITL
jgi:hypothetical protein